MHFALSRSSEIPQPRPPLPPLPLPSRSSRLTKTEVGSKFEPQTHVTFRGTQEYFRRVFWISRRKHAIQMPSGAHVELELRRLGGVDGVINLLRKPSAAESDDAFAGRVELGAALLGCKIGVGGVPTCPLSAAHGRPHDHQQQACSSRTERSAVPWGLKAFVAVLDVLLKGTRCCSRSSTCTL